MAPRTWLLVCIDTTPVCCQEGELAIVKVAAVGFGNWTCFARKELSPFPIAFESTEKFAKRIDWITQFPSFLRRVSICFSQPKIFC